MTQNALPEDWHAIDEIIRLGLAFLGSQVFLGGKFTIGEPVWENSIEQFGMYVPDEHLLPAFVFVNKPKELVLPSFSKILMGLVEKAVSLTAKSAGILVH